MAEYHRSDGLHSETSLGHINLDMPFLFLFSQEDFMLKDLPLFWFEYHMMYWQGKSYLCEVCCWWNGVVEIMEMVELETKNGYD